MTRYEFMELLGEYLPCCGTPVEPDIEDGLVLADIGSIVEVLDHIAPGKAVDLERAINTFAVPNLVRDVCARLARRVSDSLDTTRVWDCLWHTPSERGHQRFLEALDEVIAEDTDGLYSVYAQFEVAYDGDARAYLVQPSYALGVGAVVYLDAFEVPRDTMGSKYATEQILNDQYKKWELQ